MKINIICDEPDSGWIYSRFIDYIKEYSAHNIMVNETDENTFDVYHFLPYYTYKKTKKPSTAWMSHRENRKDLRAKFDSVARAVDIPLSHSRKYANMLKQYNAKQIMPGIDLDKFELRYWDAPDRDKLVVGYVGRQYTSSTRKNPKLLNKIAKLDFVDFRTTGGSMDDDDIPLFYADLDFVVSPAIIEGGPMAITEALAVGVPVICFENVGVADEFDDGVIRIPYNDSNAFIGKIRDMWKKKTYRTWYNYNVGKKLREQVEEFTWQNFVKKHDEVWESLHNESG